MVNVQQQQMLCRRYPPEVRSQQGVLRQIKRPASFRRHQLRGFGRAFRYRQIFQVANRQRLSACRQNLLDRFSGGRGHEIGTQGFMAAHKFIRTLFQRRELEWPCQAKGKRNIIDRRPRI